MSTFEKFINSPWMKWTEQVYGKGYVDLTPRQMGILYDLAIPPATPIDWRPPSITVAKPTRFLDSYLESTIDAILMLDRFSEFMDLCEEKQATRVSLLCDYALESMNIREATNKNDGTIVEKIQKILPGGERGQAWCAYKEQVRIAYAEKKTGKKSLIYASGSCASVVGKSPKEVFVSVTSPRPGDSVYFEYTRGSRKGKHHTGSFKRWDIPHEWALMTEGNTSEGLEDGAPVREGGGLYLTRRKWDLTGSETGAMIWRVLRPWPEEII